MFLQTNAPIMFKFCFIDGTISNSSLVFSTNVATNIISGVAFKVFYSRHLKGFLWVLGGLIHAFKAVNLCRISNNGIL